MEQPSGRIEELREQAAQARVRALEAHRGLIEELSGVWRELNELGGGPDVRKLRDRVAGDIARLEKLDLVFDAEWLEDVRQAAQRSGGA